MKKIPFDSPPCLRQSWRYFSNVSDDTDKHADWIHFFFARRDEFPESYWRTPGVGVSVRVSVRVRVRVHKKNFNLAYNAWTTIGRAFLFHMCIPSDKTFPWVPKFLT